MCEYSDLFFTVVCYWLLLNLKKMVLVYYLCTLLWQIAENCRMSISAAASQLYLGDCFLDPEHFVKGSYNVAFFFVVAAAAAAAVVVVSHFYSRCF